MSDGTTSFGELLRRFRSAAVLSQEELAEHAGLSRHGISDLERGARQVPHLGTVRLLADALGLGDADRMALAGCGASRAAPSHRRGTVTFGDAFVPDAADPAHWPRARGRRRPRPAAPTSVPAPHPDRTGRRRQDPPRPPGRGAIHPEFADGAVFVPLAAVTDPALVLSAIARALDIRETGERSLAEALAVALRERRLLLVLDNFEHVLAVAADVAHLLADVPATDRVGDESRAADGSAGNGAS